MAKVTVMHQEEDSCTVKVQGVKVVVLDEDLEILQFPDVTIAAIVKDPDRGDRVTLSTGETLYGKVLTDVTHLVRLGLMEGDLHKMEQLAAAKAAAEAANEAYRLLAISLGGEIRGDCYGEDYWEIPGVPGRW